jgi:serine acetyltransferase
MSVFIFRVLLKLTHWIRSMAVRHTWAVRSSQGLDGVVQLLRSVAGDDAVDVLRANGAQVGPGTRVLAGLVVHNAERDFANLRIGQACHVGREVMVDLMHSIRIGDRVTISMRTMLITHTDVGDSNCGLARSGADIEIEDDVYIGAGAIVLPGIRLGARSIVAAGAVVTRDTPPGAVVSGVPARLHASTRSKPAFVKNHERTEGGHKP